jgi:hypothetical protein
MPTSEALAEPFAVGSGQIQTFGSDETSDYDKRGRQVPANASRRISATRESSSGVL